MTAGRETTTHFYSDREAQKIHDRSCDRCSSGREATGCGDRHEDDGLGWLLLCTLPEGHEGDHLDDEAGKTWPSPPARETS